MLADLISKSMFRKNILKYNKNMYSHYTDNADSSDKTVCFVLNQNY